MVIKYRVISGWVTVMGPPLSICARNRGITEPLEPSTFPKRVVINRVLQFGTLLKDWVYISAKRLDAPITLVGLTVLSVESMTNFSTPKCTDSSATFLVPPTLTEIASKGLF